MKVALMVLKWVDLKAYSKVGKLAENLDVWKVAEKVKTKVEQ